MKESFEILESVLASEGYFWCWYNCLSDLGGFDSGINFFVAYNLKFDKNILNK